MAFQDAQGRTHDTLATYCADMDPVSGLEHPRWSFHSVLEETEGFFDEGEEPIGGFERKQTMILCLFGR